MAGDFSYHTDRVFNQGIEEGLQIAALKPQNPGGKTEFDHPALIEVAVTEVGVGEKAGVAV